MGRYMLDTAFMTIDAAPVRNHFQVLIAHGMPKKSIEKVLQVTLEELEIMDSRVPFLNNIKMLELGTRLVRQDMALILGAAASLEKMGVCGFIFRNCRNLEEVTEHFIRYQRLLYALSTFELVKRNGYVVLKHSIEGRALKKYIRLSTELGFASVIATIQNLVGQKADIDKIHFSFPQPDYIEAYQRLFQTQFAFNQRENAIFFEPSQLKHPISQNQPYLKDLLIQHAEQLMDQLRKENSLKNQVQYLIIRSLPKGEVDIEMISSQLKMSRWTLTRNLNKEGVTFQNIMTDLRKELALTYLEDQALSVSDIAFLVGYSEISAFSKAFKTWTGKNPYSYRKTKASA